MENIKKNVEKELLEQMLEKQSEIALSYGVLLNHAVTKDIRNTALSILNEEHMLQMEIMDEQQKRGWKKLAKASANQLEREIHSFCSTNLQK